MTAEIGRQPWIIHNLMRTADAASAIPLQQVIISLTLFVTVYGIVFAFYLFYLFAFIRKGPTTDIKLDTAVDELQQTPFKYMAPESEREYYK